MFKTLLSRNYQRRPAQALVEFTLTALVFLFLIVMIIEVARIMQAYVTIQHAAREGVRYAITGEFDPKYGTNPLVGWTANSGEPLKRIRPCWPLFYDDHYAATASGAGWIDSDYYEPYRDARTCSVEEATVRGMTGLIMNPNAGPLDPDYYEIVVSGYALDTQPSTGDFERGNGTGGVETLNYATYYTLMIPNPPGPDVNYYEGDRPGAARGYAGDPGNRVQVQIAYRVRMITPLLESIVRSVRLYTLASATVETFGSTGLQREAILPPDPIEPLSLVGDDAPPDLYISSFNCTPTPALLGDDLECNVAVANKGETGAAAVGKLRVYSYHTTATPPVAPIDPLDVPFSTTGMVHVGDYSIGALLAGFGTYTITFNFTPPAKGSYYLYAWVDAFISAPNDPEDGAIEEIKPGYEEVERIDNNLGEEGPLLVTEDADLSITAFTATPPTLGVNPGPGEEIVYDVTVLNSGPTSPAVNVTVTPGSLPAELECVSAASCVLSLPNIASGTTASGSFRLRVKAGTVGPVGTNTCVTADSDTDEINTANNTACAAIDVGGDVSLIIDKSIPAPATVNYGDTTTQITYTLTATNTGSGSATNVTITDVLNSKFVFVSAVPLAGAWSCTPGSTVTCVLPSLAGGASASVEVKVTVAAGTPAGDIPNQAEVRCTEMAAAVPNKQSSVVNATVLGVDIDINKFAGVTSINSGGRFTYTVRAVNPTSSYDTTGVTVRDILPTTYVQYVNHSTTHGTYDQASGLWTIGALARGATAELIITVDALGSVAAGTNIDNTATLQSVTPPDTNSTNNAETARVTVSSNAADMVMQKSVSAATARPGDILTYTLTLTNNGLADVTGRTVRDTNLRGAFLPTPNLPNPDIPPLFQFVIASATHGSFAPATGEWTGINLTSGQTAIATIQVRVLGRGADEQFINTAQVLPGTVPEGTPGNESASATVQIDWPDPVFINAGNRASGCVTSSWGSEDPVLLRNYSWQVGPTAAWSLLNGLDDTPINDGLINLNDFHFITNLPDSAPFTQLGPGGQNLFGCSTRTRGGIGDDFIYQFNTLLPGRWRLFVVFAEHLNDDNDDGRINVTAINGTTTQTLLTNYKISTAVEAHPDIGRYRRSYNGDWWVHYIVERFNDVTVSSPGNLQIRFIHANSQDNGRVNGLGVEYIGP